MPYLLDSNAVIALMAGRQAFVARVEGKASGDVLLSTIVLHELYYGAFFSDRIDRNLDRLADLDFPTLSFDGNDARAAGQVRARLRRAGTPIGPYDVLIAGQALARDLTLVTANIGEFSRVDGLSTENWAD